MGVLEPGGHEADLAGSQDVLLTARGHEDADVDRLGASAGLNELEPVAALEVAIHHADVGHDALVLVVGGVEHEGAERGVGVAGGRGGFGHDAVQQLAHAGAGLGGDAHDLGRVSAQKVHQFAGDLFGARGGQVGLVDDGNDGQVQFERGVGVGQSLGLDALGGVDQQHGALAGGQGAGHLVAEVHVAGGVDQVERVGRAANRGAACGPGGP